MARHVEPYAARPGRGTGWSTCGALVLLVPLMAPADLSMDRSPSPSPSPDGVSGSAGGPGSLARVEHAYVRQREGGGLKLDRLQTPASAANDTLPRFEEHIEVHRLTPKAAFERYLQGYDLNTNRPRPPGLDLIQLFTTLKELNRGNTPRYFLYLARHGEVLEPRLREDRLSAQALYSPGVTYELMGEFVHFEDARRAEAILAEKIAASRSDAGGAAGQRP